MSRWLIVAALVTSTGSVARAQDRTPASTAAARQARGEAAAKAYVRGQYEEALAIYIDLYAQSNGRPEYLRNIGRCQQKLNRHGPAIESFREYLRKAKNITAEEKTEVRGFIAELEAARAGSSGTGGPATPAGPGPAAAAVPPTAGPTIAPSVSEAPQAAAPTVGTGPATTVGTGPAPTAGTGPTSPPGPPEAAPAPAPWSPPSGGPPPLPTAPPVDLRASVPAPEPPPAFAPQASAPPYLTYQGGDAPPPARGRGLKVGAVIALGAAAVMAVSATALLINARSTYDSGVDKGCKTSDRPASCADTADSVALANTLSKVLYA
ncbi:MAG: hypothetical protein ABUL67_02090, partial [Haliangium ochraceum]